jgi:hypothetical protein
VPEDTAAASAATPAAKRQCAKCLAREGEGKRGRAGAHDKKPAGSERPGGYNPWHRPTELELQREFLWRIGNVARVSVDPEELERVHATVDVAALALDDDDDDAKPDAYAAEPAADARGSRRVPVFNCLAELLLALHEAVVARGGLTAMMRTSRWKAVAKMLAVNAALVPVFLPGATEEV